MVRIRALRADLELLRAAVLDDLKHYSHAAEGLSTRICEKVNHFIQAVTADDCSVNERRALGKIIKVASRCLIAPMLSDVAMYSEHNFLNAHSRSDPLVHFATKHFPAVAPRLKLECEWLQELYFSITRYRLAQRRPPNKHHFYVGDAVARELAFAILTHLPTSAEQVAQLRALLDDEARFAVTLAKINFKMTAHTLHHNRIETQCVEALASAGIPLPELLPAARILRPIESTLAQLTAEKREAMTARTEVMKALMRLCIDTNAPLHRGGHRPAPLVRSTTFPRGLPNRVSTEDYALQIVHNLDESLRDSSIRSPANDARLRPSATMTDSGVSTL